VESFPHAQRSPENKAYGGQFPERCAKAQKISLDTLANKGLWIQGDGDRATRRLVDRQMRYTLADSYVMSSGIFALGRAGHERATWGAGGRGWSKTEELPENFDWLLWALTPHLSSQISRTIVR